MIVPDKGFTLLEILVAMAVLAIVLTSAFKLQSSSLVLSEAAHFKAVAPVLAERQLAVLALDGYDSDDMAGAFDTPYNGYTWKCDVADFTDKTGWEEILSESQAGRLKQIRLTVSNPGQGRQFTLNTWRYLHEE